MIELILKISAWVILVASVALGLLIAWVAREPMDWALVGINAITSLSMAMNLWQMREWS